MFWLIKRVIALLIAQEFGPLFLVILLALLGRHLFGRPETERE